MRGGGGSREGDLSSHSPHLLDCWMWMWMEEMPLWGRRNAGCGCGWCREEEEEEEEERNEEGGEQLGGGGWGMGGESTV